MTMSTPDAVAAIAAVFTDAETKALAIRHAVRDAKEAFKDINTNGDVGFLEATKFATQFDALATQFVADLYTLHSAMTVAAQAHSIDLPSIEGGGGR